MERKLFEKIINDNKIPKIHYSDIKFFKFDSEDLIIYFSFKHNAFVKNEKTGLDERVTLNVFSRNSIDLDVHFYKINETALIMVNSDIFDHAMTFLININITARTISAKIKDFPNLGSTNITEQELNGLEVKY